MLKKFTGFDDEPIGNPFIFSVPPFKLMTLLAAPATLLVTEMPVPLFPLKNTVPPFRLKTPTLFPWVGARSHWPEPAY